MKGRMKKEQKIKEVRGDKNEEWAGEIENDEWD